MSSSKLVSKLMLVVSCGVLGASLSASVPGCGKKDATVTKDDEKSSKSKDSSGYVRGEVLKHVPSKCNGYLYLDFAGLRAVDAIGKNAGDLQDSAIEGAGSNDAKKLKKALKALDGVGIDPTRDAREMALCVGSERKQMTVAIGGDFAGKEALAGLEKALTAMMGSGDNDSVDKKKKGKLEYLEVDDVMMAMVSDTVLVATMDLDALEEAKSGFDVGSIWKLEDTRLVTGGFSRKKGSDGDIDISGTIDQSGDDFSLAMVAKAKGDAKKDLEDDPDAVKKEIKDKGLESMAAVFDKVPAKGLAEDVRAAKVTVDGGTIKGKMTVQGKNLQKAIEKYLAMSAEDREKLFR